MKDNKEKILLIALKLFNEKGTSVITTNYICEELSISPGNLYYHFRSKEEIILSLFKRMIAKWDQTPIPQEPNLKNLYYMYERTFEYLWEYRFIHREVSSLYKQIAEFKAIFEIVQKKRLKEIQAFIHQYSKARIFRTLNHSEIYSLARTIWFFSLYWVSYLETEGKAINRKRVKESVLILKNILQPYLMEEIK
ncbi:MAG: TetR/AcrR family transcriptional regulator [Leptospirales bacterium]